MKLTITRYIFVLILLFFTSSIINSVYGQGLNQQIDKWKGKTFSISIYNGYENCQYYTVMTNGVSKSSSKITENGKEYCVSRLLLRGDEAQSQTKYNFKITYPTTFSFSFVYDIYSNSNLKLFLDKCNSDLYDDFLKESVNYQYGFNNTKLCLYHPKTVSNLNFKNDNKITTNTNEIVLENKLGFNNIMLPLVLGALGFFGLLGLIIYFKGFQV